MLVAHLISLMTRPGPHASPHGSLAQGRPALPEGGARVDPHAADLLRYFAAAVVLTADFAAAGSDIAYAEIADTADSRIVSAGVHCRGSCNDLRRTNKYGTIDIGYIAAVAQAMVVLNIHSLLSPAGVHVPKGVRRIEYYDGEREPTTIRCDAECLECWCTCDAVVRWSARASGARWFDFYWRAQLHNPSKSASCYLHSLGGWPSARHGRSGCASY